MEKIDIKKEYSQFYRPKKGAMETVDVPAFSFLMIDGVDARQDSPGFTGAIQALYAVAYKIKFISKIELERDYSVMPLEGLWWADDMEAFIESDKEQWKWTLMIHQPDWIDGELFDRARREQIKNKPELAPHIELMRLDSYREGNAIQTLYFGPYSDEGPVIAEMHRRIFESGGRFEGENQKHHEIYLSDFRRTAPEKLKTIIRQPYSS